MIFKVTFGTWGLPNKLSYLFFKSRQDFLSHWATYQKCKVITTIFSLSNIFCKASNSVEFKKWPMATSPPPSGAIKIPSPKNLRFCIFSYQNMHFSPCSQSLLEKSFWIQHHLLVPVLLFWWFFFVSAILSNSPAQVFYIMVLLACNHQPCQYHKEPMIFLLLICNEKATSSQFKVIPYV